MRILVLFTLLFSTLAYGQRQTNKSRSELGFIAGGSYYLGDLNQFAQFRNTHLSGGLIYRYNIHSRTAFRTTFSYGKVSADDADSKIELNKSRGLSFESSIWELAAGVEFNYFPFQIGHRRYKGTGYLFAELAMFRMNPKTEYNGDLTELQPLGTEGQGTSLSSKARYGRFQMSMPLGVGARVSLGKMASLGVEFGIRKTFTDYLDDVGSNYYVDYDALLAESGPIAAELSNRSGSRTGRRGNAAGKDWYVMTGVSLTFALGKPTSCPPR
ncbi:MAG: DUF6089 family protein [Crocinitomicaceae bacterium]|nr:DUF6089 family protein [Crocinitomicaceae bacterium]